MELEPYETDLAGLTKQEKAVLCFRAVQALGYAVSRIDQAWRKVGKLLSWMKKTKLYKDYASGTAVPMQTDECSWARFIKLIDMGITVSHADNLIRTHDALDMYLESRNIKYSRLLEAKPLITDENREDILNAAEHLPADGWKNTIREIKGKVTQDDCEHSLESWGRCTICGKFIKI